MPMIDLKAPRGALPAEALPDLVERLTAALLEHREVPDTPASRANVWLFVHEAATYVGGVQPADPPRIVATFTVVEGGMTDEHRAGLVADATAAIHAAVVGARVWVLVQEIRDGGWGADGVVTRLADAQAILGAPEPPA